MTLLHSELRFRAPDDIYESLLSLSDGLDDTAAHSALAAFAWLLANHIGDDAVVLEAIARVKLSFKEFPEAATVGQGSQKGKAFHVGGALDSLRKIIALQPTPSLPGKLTS